MVVVTCLLVQARFAQAERGDLSLCTLQENATAGEYVMARVAGVYSEGLELGVLEDAACPAQGTWVELALKSARNRKKLRRLLERSRKARVVFYGRFYGPGIVDANLPEAIRRSYQPGWGHLSAFKTKLVVISIQSAQALPAEVPKKPN